MTRHLSKAACVVLACCALASIAIAPARAQSPESLAAAKDLMITMKVADNMRAIMPTLMRALKPALVQNRPEIERDYDALTPKLLEAMSSRLDEILDKIAGVYARNFTVDEIKQITAFYGSPTGQKVVQRLPGVMQESLAIGQQFGRTIGAELQQRMIEELRKKGHNI